MRCSPFHRSVLIAAVVLVLSPAIFSQSTYVASFNGFGPVRIGMTRTQAGRALGVSVIRNSGYGDNSCYYASPRNGFKSIAFMMSGTRIVRIDINTKKYATDEGARVGDTEARIKQLYRGRYKVTQHHYVTAGHYIEIKGPGGLALLFETDGKHVTTYRVGKTEEVGYIEGCS